MTKSELLKQQNEVIENLKKQNGVNDTLKKQNEVIETLTKENNDMKKQNGVIDTHTKEIETLTSKIEDMKKDKKIKPEPVFGVEWTVLGRLGMRNSLHTFNIKKFAQVEDVPKGWEVLTENQYNDLENGKSI